MTTIYDGGPANPFAQVSGISIRDYFATAIMTGVYSAGAQATISAEDAYRAADLMLVARTADLTVQQTVVTTTAPVVSTVEETTTDTAETVTPDTTSETTV